eukprot:scaffold14546_cov121-Isochrysis_galbana.AAC.3
MGRERGGVTGRHRTEVSRRAAVSVSRVSTKDFFFSSADCDADVSIFPVEARTSQLGLLSIVRHVIRHGISPRRRVAPPPPPITHTHECQARSHHPTFLQQPLRPVRGDRLKCV